MKSTIPLRLTPAPRTKTERARADALAEFHRGHLDELVGHYGLPINRVVQIALRHLHRQVFPSQYAHDDSSAEELTAEAVSGLGALTQRQAAAVLANAHTPGAELAKQLGLKPGEKILTLGDFFARAEQEAVASPKRTRPAAKRAGKSSTGPAKAAQRLAKARK